MQCTLKTKMLEFDRAVPRYTSYPTAPQFKPADITMQKVYKAVTAEDTLSLYIHIPFCAKMCWYCGCHTKITNKYDPVAEYVGYLLQEINLTANQITDNTKVTHIHFGGGSPGMLSPIDFSKIMECIKDNFFVTRDVEIAIEIDPRGVTEERVATYAKHGVNRVSLGSQDFNDSVLASVNRQQPYHLSYSAVGLFRDYGIDHINLDLIYGLPGQSIDSARKTMDLALTLNPSRIAYFGYAHVPWMKKHMRLINENALPDKALRFDLFEEGARLLEGSGYKAVGIDHFVQDGDSMLTAFKNKSLRRNFQGYTTDKANIMVGLGVSSIGKTHDAYLQNSADMPIYKARIDQGNVPIVKTCTITEEDRLRGNIIEQIMCYFIVDLKQFNGDFDKELNSLGSYVRAGFVQIDNKVIKVSEKARPIARLVAAAFDAYLPDITAQKHSRAI